MLSIAKGLAGFGIAAAFHRQATGRLRTGRANFCFYGLSGRAARSTIGRA
jgi:hypothetical protein